MKLKNLLVLLLLLGSAFVLSACSGSEGPRESGAQGESSSTGDKGPAGEKALQEIKVLLVTQVKPELMEFKLNFHSQAKD